MSTLRLIHHSVRKKNGSKQRPHMLTRAVIPISTREFIEIECLDIYVRMANSGASLHDTLIAIYLSGMSVAAAGAE